MSVEQSEEFGRIVESLLAQEFICQYKDEIAYDYLSSETYRDNVDRFLRKIGRCLRQTEDKSTYYCAYLDIDSSTVRKHLSKEFKTTINELEPLCRWLSLIMSATQRDAPISPGDALRQGEILSGIEHAAALEEDLALIVRSGPFASKKDKVSDQLDHVLNALNEQGYLHRSSPSSSIYIATGKWSYLFEVLEFIHTHEEIATSPLNDEKNGELW